MTEEDISYAKSSVGMKLGSRGQKQKFDSTVVKELSDRLPHRRLSSVIPEIIHGPHRQC